MIPEKLVKCDKAGECGNPDCMHYLPHKPIYFGQGGWCDKETSICPIINKPTLCQKEG